MIFRWRVFCPRCSFAAWISATSTGIRDHIDCDCPSCRRPGLDALNSLRMRRQQARAQ